MNGEDYRRAKARYSKGVDRAEVEARLRAYAAAGIVFYRDGGDPYGAGRYAKRIAARLGVDVRTPVFAIHKIGHYGSIVGKGFDTIARYHALVLEAAVQGADFIKIMASGILDFDAEGAVTGEALERSLIREMIHIAHEEGFAVMVHVNGDRPALDCIEAGADSIEHGNFMEEETLCALAGSRTVWVPTIATLGNLIGDGRYPDRTLRSLYERQEAAIRRAGHLGAKIAAGSDAGAYRVPHVTGTMDEQRSLLRILGGTQEAERRLAGAEEEIRLRFQRGTNRYDIVENSLNIRL